LPPAITLYKKSRVAADSLVFFWSRAGLFYVSRIAAPQPEAHPSI
jgi:hypothetical protein